MSQASLHPEDRKFFEAVEQITRLAADRFGLKVKSVEPKKYAGRYVLGLCSHDGRIRILIRKAKKGVFEKARLHDITIIETVAHELAHLKHFDHGKEHEKLTKEIFNFLWVGKGR